MWVLGVSFVITGVLTRLGNVAMTVPVMYVLGVFAVYTIIEAIYYRYVLSYAFAVLGILLFSMYVINL